VQTATPYSEAPTVVTNRSSSPIINRTPPHRLPNSCPPCSSSSASRPSVHRAESSGCTGCEGETEHGSLLVRNHAPGGPTRQRGRRGQRPTFAQGLRPFAGPAGVLAEGAFACVALRGSFRGLLGFPQENRSANSIEKLLASVFGCSV
jgi:hypothetical protein